MVTIIAVFFAFLLWWFFGIVSAIMIKIKKNSSRVRRHYDLVSKETSDRYNVTLDDIQVHIMLGWLWGATGFIAYIIYAICVALYDCYLEHSEGESPWRCVLWAPKITYKQEDKNTR